MERKLKYTIEEKYNGQSIGMFLKEKEYSRAVIIELKKIYKCSYDEFFEGLDINM